MNYCFESRDPGSINVMHHFETNEGAAERTPARGLVAAPASAPGAGVIREWLRSRYGVAGTATRLTGELDLNYRIETDHRVLMLKLLHPGEHSATAEFQTSLLAWVGDPSVGLPVPEIVPTLEGELTARFEAQDGVRRARLTTFLPGSSSRALIVDDESLYALGAQVARLDDRLRGYHGDIVDGGHPWTIMEPARSKALLADAPTVAGRSDIIACIDRFVVETLPHLHALPRQLIHNDLNRDNVLAVGGEITGLLDFGDAISAPRIVDLAVTATYFCRTGDPADLIRSVMAMARGYASVLPLDPAELAVLVPSLRGRAAIALAVALSRATRIDDPAYAAYVTRNSQATRRVADVAAAIDDRRALDALTNALR